MLSEKERETAQIWENKTELEQTFCVGLHGAPDLKGEEKIQYLGVFREQVIAVLSLSQIREAAIYPEIIHALNDKRSAKMIINGNVTKNHAKKYHALAQKMRKTYTVVYDTCHETTTGLVIASNEAVDIAKVEIEDRRTRLHKLGLPDAMINAAGQKICSDCLEKILQHDPEESINYQTLSWLDQLLGEHCPAHENI